MGAARRARASLLRRLRRAGGRPGARRAAERGGDRGDARRARRDRLLGRHRHRPVALRRRPASVDRPGAGPPRCGRAAAARGCARARPADARDLPRLPAPERPARRRPRSSTSPRRSVTRATARRSACSRSIRSSAGGTRLEAILGPRHEAVRSSHHQGVGRVGAGLVESAYAEDGSLEAIEDPSKRFALGVLWHPEMEEDDKRLFEALVAEARLYRAAAERADLEMTPARRFRRRPAKGGDRHARRTPRSEDCPPSEGAYGTTCEPRRSMRHYRRGASFLGEAEPTTEGPKRPLRRSTG